MARTPLLRSIRQLARDVQASRATGIPVNEISAMRAERAVSRRRFLIGAAAGAAALAVPGRARAAKNQPKITIVGGGIAGLTCALTLRDKGLDATVYEASGRLGGRMFSNTGYFAAHQVSEWCGELIDTGHHTVRNLAARFSLPLDDLHAAEPNGSDETYFFGGQYYPKAAESLPHKSPLFGASYSYWRVGQYTDFGGFEGAPQGGVQFCGEHTSQDFQGFMEGGASTGKQTAKDLVALIKK